MMNSVLQGQPAVIRIQDRWEKVLLQAVDRLWALQAQVLVTRRESKVRAGGTGCMGGGNKPRETLCHRVLIGRCADVRSGYCKI